MSSESPFLNTDTIDNAADLVNSTLISKAYIDEELKYLSIDWKELLKDQVSNIEITETIYNNDKNNLNILYSLLQSLDRSKSQHLASNKIITQKDATIQALNKKIDTLSKQLQDTEIKLANSEQINQAALSKKVKELSHVNKIQSLDLRKLKNWCNDVKVKYQVEMKKKNVEIEELRNKLLNKRNLSSTITYGIPLNPGSSPNITSDSNINSNIVYHNNPIIDNSVKPLVDHGLVQSVLNNEYEDIVSNLTKVIESLMSENLKFSSFLKSLSEYYLSINTQLSNIHHKTTNIKVISNPSETLDFDRIKLIDLSSNKMFEEVESFEIVTRPILENIYRNYEHISNLLDALDNSAVSFSVSESSRILQLANELEITKKNWQNALDTIENWKKYLHLNSIDT